MSCLLNGKRVERVISSTTATVLEKRGPPARGDTVDETGRIGVAVYLRFLSGVEAESARLCRGGARAEASGQSSRGVGTAQGRCGAHDGGAELARRMASGWRRRACAGAWRAPRPMRGRADGVGRLKRRVYYMRAVGVGPQTPRATR